MSRTSSPTDRLDDGLVSRRELLKLGSGLTAAVLLGSTLPAFAQEPVRGGTLRIALTGDPPGLITVVNAAGLAYQTGSKVVEGLFSYEHDLTPRPQLATDWSVSDDGLVYTFALRKGVKWHDGKPFTSADVAYSILTLKEVHPNGIVNFKNIDRIETPDEHTAVFHLSKPIPYLIYTFASLLSPIIPKHLYEGTDPGQNPATNAPVGTGPFVFTEWVRGSHIIYDRNEEYWDAPRPYLDRIIYQIITDGSARAAALESDQIDIGSNPVPLADIDRFEKNPDFVVETKGFTYDASVQRIEFNLDRPEVSQLPVRQAVSLAIDQNALVNVAWYGRAIAANGPISPVQHRWFLKDLPPHEFDPAKAEKLLDEAGFKRGADGWRFTVSVSHNPAEGHKRSAEYLKDALATVGIRADVVSQDFATYVKRIYTDRDFDIVVSALSGFFDPTPGTTHLHHSSSFKPGIPFSNGPHYNSPKVDALLDAGAVETDPAKRFEIFAEFQRQVAADIPALVLIAPKPVNIARKTVHDYAFGAEGLNGNLAYAYIDKQ